MVRRAGLNTGPQGGARPTWFTLEFATMLLIDEASCQSAEQYGRCQETYSRNYTRHHRPRQPLVRQLCWWEGICRWQRRGFRGMDSRDF